MHTTTRPSPPANYAQQLESRISTEIPMNWGIMSQYIRTSLPLLVVDLVTFLCCFIGGSYLLQNFFGFEATITPWLVLVLSCQLVACFLLMELYDGVGMHPVYEFRQMVVCLSIIFISSNCLLARDSEAWGLLATFPLLLIAVPVARSLLRGVLCQTDWWGIRAIVFSANRRINKLFPNHLKNACHGVKPVGFIQDKVPSSLIEELADYHLGSLSQSNLVGRAHQASCAVIHRHDRNDRQIFQFVEQHLSSYSRILIHPDDPSLPSLWMVNRNGSVSFEDRLNAPGARTLKRTVDVLLSSLALLVFGPVMLGIMAWIRLTSPGDIFFGHERIGINGRKFKALKFRSMVSNGDEVLQQHLENNPAAKAEWEATYKLQNDPRITAPGRFLRKTSLDELPQLWNVLRGDMSLVGPRPIVAGEVERYQESYKSYLRVVPGITGLWQVSGRNLTTYRRRVELDEYYVRNWSVWFDLYILGRTIKTVLFREGAF